jgi:peptidoglycan/LPS O-acetylase OafA/YrhL
MSRPATHTGTYSRHFYSLDVLRGLAALMVVVFHWRHFFYYDAKPLVDADRLPLYPWLKLFYTSGWQAVDLFFCLSGFVFFWLYSQKIATRKTSLKEFFVLRFSRLYPLHFLTLLLVAGGQLFALREFGSYFVYSHNSLYHFVLQLFFASNWGLQRGSSFNGPTWSVSIEILLYALFFIVCFFRFNRWWHALLIIFLSPLLLKFDQGDVSRGIISFYSGALAYLIFDYLWQRGLTVRHVAGLIALTALLWLAIPWVIAQDFQLPASLPHQALLSHLLDLLKNDLLVTLLFPLTLLTLAVCEAYRGTLGKRVSFLGNISYSVYLIHFPLQLAAILAAQAFSIPNTIFSSPWTMLGFFCILIPLSLCSYEFFERPLQRTLRSRLL